MDTCPHCNGKLTAHQGDNTGLFHCNTCGCCFDEEGGLRPGTIACAPTAAASANVDVQQYLSKIADLEDKLANNHELEDLEKAFLAQEEKLKAAEGQVKDSHKSQTDLEESQAKDKAELEETRAQLAAAKEEVSSLKADLKAAKADNK